MVVMIPYVLGFQPTESLVVVALLGPRKRFGPILRIDVVGVPAMMAGQAEQVTVAMKSNHVSLVLLVAFSSAQASSQRLVEVVSERLGRDDISVEEAIRSDGRRWWSYTCDSQRCCPSEGTAYDVGASRVAVEAVVAGMSFAADREALRHVFDRADGETREQVAAAAAELGAGRLALPAGVEVADFQRRMSRALADPAALTPEETARLAIAVTLPHCLESALATIERAEAEQHFELWRTVMSQVEDTLLPTVGCLAAFSAWLDGRGVLASHALDTVLAIEPSHPVALSIEQLLIRVVNPAIWDSRRPLSDEIWTPPPIAG